MNQLLEKMKQGEHVFDVNAEAETQEEACRDDFDGDDCDGGQGEEEPREHKATCAVTPLGQGR